MICLPYLGFWKWRIEKDSSRRGTNIRGYSDAQIYVESENRINIFLRRSLLFDFWDCLFVGWAEISKGCGGFCIICSQVAWTTPCVLYASHSSNEWPSNDHWKTRPNQRIPSSAARSSSLYTIRVSSCWNSRKILWVLYSSHCVNFSGAIWSGDAVSNFSLPATRVALFHY